MSGELPLATGDRNRKPGEFYGCMLAAREQGGAILSEAWYDGAVQLPKHCHELGFFCLLLDGAYEERYVTRGNSFAPMSIVWHPPGEHHSCAMCAYGGLVFNLEIPHDRYAVFRQYSAEPKACTQHQNGDLIWLGLRAYREFRHPDACSDLVIESLTLEMMARGARIHEPPDISPGWLGRVEEKLRADCRSALAVGELADAAGVHPVHLARVFRRTYGMTVGEYQRRLRVAWAGRELLQTDTDLASIALEAGFADQSHLTRAFRQIAGMTPGEVRRISR